MEIKEYKQRKKVEKDVVLMLRIILSVCCRSVVVLMTVSLFSLPASSAYAQLPGTAGGFGPGAGETPESENAHEPIPLKLKGILKPTHPHATDWFLIEMTIGHFGEPYQFEVQKIELPDNPHSSPDQLLRGLKKYKVQMIAIGNKENLTKIGQALPDTPVAVSGLFIRRTRTFEVQDIDVFREDHLPQ